MIPTIISQLLNGAHEIKLGDVTPTRDLLFVKDTVNGFIKIAQCDEFCKQKDQCYGLYLQMKNDMSLGGQYFDNITQNFQDDLAMLDSIEIWSRIPQYVGIDNQNLLPSA